MSRCRWKRPASLRPEASAWSGASGVRRNPPGIASARPGRSAPPQARRRRGVRRDRRAPAPANGPALGGRLRDAGSCRSRAWPRTPHGSSPWPAGPGSAKTARSSCALRPSARPIVFATISQGEPNQRMTDGMMIAMVVVASCCSRMISVVLVLSNILRNLNCLSYFRPYFADRILDLTVYFLVSDVESRPPTPGFRRFQSFVSIGIFSASVE